jgi:hypothetical protein
LLSLVEKCGKDTYGRGFVMIEDRTLVQGQVLPDIIINVGPRTVIDVTKIGGRLFRSLAHPEFVNFGPSQYNLRDVKLWHHGNQQFNGGIPGYEICEHLRETENLKFALNISDADEIKKLDIKIYRQFFGGNMVPLWGSLVVDMVGNHFVLCLFEIMGKVDSVWINVKNLFGLKRPGAFFEKVGESKLTLQ